MCKIMNKSSNKNISKPISAGAILRAVATSSALESDQSVAVIRYKIKNKSSRFSYLKLAL